MADRFVTQFRISSSGNDSHDSFASSSLRLQSRLSVSKLAKIEAPTTADSDSLAELCGQPQTWRILLPSSLSQQAVSEIAPADKSRQPLRARSSLRLGLYDLS